MNADEKFVHLHVHTEYSLLDGLSQIDRLMGRAKALEMQSLAITDHGVMFGVVDFFRAAQKHDIKPVIGMEAYLAKRGMEDRDSKLDKKPYHMLLLAKNQTGYRNLLKLASEAQLRGYYYQPRIDRELMAQYSEGIIATSGCLGAEIPQTVMNGQDDDARELIGWYQEVFGPENFYLELQYHDIDVLESTNKWLAEYRKSGHTPVQFLATNDVHYVLESDHDPHDTLLCIQTSNLKTDGNRMSMSDASYHLTSHEEMDHIIGTKYNWLPDEMRHEALLNTAKVAAMCDVDLNTKGYRLPRFPVPEGYTERDYLRYLVDKGRYWRYGDDADAPVYIERMEHELGIIESMGFNTYFLIVWDLCEFARHADIWWNVRGSGAGSMVAYCLGITNLDPIQNSLIFERFLNPGRVSMPDIDLDYPDDRRAEMIEYTAQKYGSDKVAAIITFGTMGAKAAIRDVGRALDVPLGEINQAVGLIPTEARQKKIEEYVDANPELKQIYRQNNKIRRVIDTAKVLQGVARHASTHAAGVIVADQPLVEYLPLHRLTRGSDEDSTLQQVTQFPMETCESLGLLKVDFLGLSTLTILRRASDLIFKHHNKRWTMDNILYRLHEGEALTEEQQEENRMLAEAFEMMGRGETVGVFQVESVGMQQMLRGMKPQKYEHVVAGISLYRPGPMDFIPDFNKRLHGEEAPEYRHPMLEPILAETYGICVTGDTIVFDVETGLPHRIDELSTRAGQFCVQSVDDDLNSVRANVTHWHDNGVEEVYKITLKTGQSIKATADHEFLTEDGWVRLQDLVAGCYIATPPKLFEPQQPLKMEREKLRVLAYLIADGSLASGASVDFVNKHPAMLETYVNCLDVCFDDVVPSYTGRLREVTRVGVRSKYTGKSEHSLLLWMRELGFKKPGHIREHPCGLRSHEKSIPEFVFQLSDDDIAFFVASLWDCDGYVDNQFCHYKTISEDLAWGVQMLLLRLGFQSTIHTSDYSTATRGGRTAYQVTLYDTANFASMISPYSVTEKFDVVCDRASDTTINRRQFVVELDATVQMSRSKLMKTYGIDRQHFYTKRMKVERIAAKVVRPFVEQVSLPQTIAKLRLNWDVISTIEYVGQERVYDLSVEGTHNFVANGIVVHNCVYQEQIMQIASELFDYELGEADLMRRAVSKKKQKELVKHRAIFLERGPQNGIAQDVADKIFDDIEFFANYGFNKSHAADYAMVTVQTAFLKCHYPAEYMAALLSVYRETSDKVAAFLEECGRLNIPILPPDVNHSNSDFDIQTLDDGTRGVRFGMAAIKNASVVGVKSILDARVDGGFFVDLTDFAERVDLRHVGKRTLESLVKVGALDDFGNRTQLLDQLDRLMSFSTNHHQAKASGQMSMFGGDTGVKDKLTMPEMPQILSRERLDWEKELLGFYVTDHPVDNIRRKTDVGNTVQTFQLAEFTEFHRDKGISMVALIGNVREIPTKRGDMMAVLTVEDRYGSVEVVLFPRSWEGNKHVVREKLNDVVLIRGKFDMRNDRPQIIGESVTTEFEVFASNEQSAYSDSAPVYNSPPLEDVDGPPPMDFSDYDGDTASNGNANGNGYNGADNGHKGYSQAVAQPHPSAHTKPAPSEPREENDSGIDWDSELETNPHLEENGVQQEQKWAIAVYLDPDADENKTLRRFKRIHGAFLQYSGDDRFMIIVRRPGDPYKLEFPQERTGWCEALQASLVDIVGEANIKVFEDS